MPGTKSFTLVKSTLFLPLGLTPLLSPAGTWPWERAGRPTNRRHLSPTSVAPPLPSNHPAILCHSVKGTLQLTRCSGKTWSTQKPKEHKWRRMSERLQNVRNANNSDRRIVSLFLWQLKSAAAVPRANICMDFWQVGPRISAHSRGALTSISWNDVQNNYYTHGWQRDCHGDR